MGWDFAFQLLQLSPGTHNSFDGPSLFSQDTEAAGLVQLKTLLLLTDLLRLHVSYWIGKGPSVYVPAGTA